MKTIPHPSYPSTILYVSDRNVKSAMETLIGRFNFVRAPGEPGIRRLLDLAPHDGIFAAWFYSRFPYAWITMVEADEERQKLCVVNAPPGGRVVKADPQSFVTEVQTKNLALAFDAVHANWGDFPVSHIHWDALKLAIIEHEPSDLHYVHNCFVSDFDLVAADRGFTAWVKT